MSGAQLVEHVINDLTMFVLRAEQDDFGILADFNSVSRWPVEQVTAVDHFMCTVCVGDGEFTLQQVAPSADIGTGRPPAPEGAARCPCRRREKNTRR